MKKRMIFIITLLLLLVLCGCSGETPAPTRSEHIHDYKNERVIAPPCVKDGYTLRICDCGALMRTAYQSKIGHDFVSVQVVEPTCTESGYTLMSCQRCETEQTDVVPAEGHNYEAVQIVLPTADEKEHILRACHCGDIVKDFETPLSIQLKQDPEGYLYYYFSHYVDVKTQIYSEDALLVVEPVVQFLFAKDDRNLYFVKVAEPNKIYYIAQNDLSAQKVIYESTYGTITRVDSDSGPDGFIQVTEGSKRLILVDLSTGEIQVLLEVYSLQSASAYFDEEGNISFIHLYGQPTENHKNYTYFYYPDTGEFQEHNG